MTYRTDHPLTRALLEIGPRAIEREDDAALDDYFAPDFVFHGGGADTDREGLKTYFRALRRAFPDLRFDRREVVAADAYLSSRTIVSGTFEGRFDASPVGPLEPHGRRVEWEVLNVMRFDGDGRAVEEWVQTDNRAFLRALGVEPERTGEEHAA